MTATDDPFTYSDTHRGDLDRVRFHIQDTERGHGPLPDDANFTDNEINSILAAEGSWQRAVAASFERLAAAWRKYPNLEADQFGLSRSHISRGYSEDAERWRKKYGYAGDPLTVAGRSVAVSRGAIRTDGFGEGVVGASDDLA